MRKRGKALLTGLVARLAYYTGLDDLMYWLNRGAKRVITFHNVIPDELYEKARGAGCMEGAREFRNKIDAMAERFSFSTNLNDPTTVTVTFDDGTLNEYEVAGAILKDMGIPAILFVAGDVVGATPEKALVTDKLIIWCMFAPDEAVKAAFGVEGISRDELWVKYVQPGYRGDSAVRGKNFLAQLEKICSVETLYEKLPKEWVRLRMSGVTEAQLDDLRVHGWKIGWHTWSHYPLGMLDDAAKRQELNSPPDYRSVVLSYPYGDIEAIGESSLEIAKEFGYPSAVSNDPEYSPCRGQYFLHRMVLPGSKYELHMVLSGLKYFIKYRRLLPCVTNTKDAHI